MIYGYARVSSDGQSRYGTSLDDQVDALKAAGATKIFKEPYTGTKMHRPEFDKLVELLQSGDMLVVTKLDRLGRTAVGVLTMINNLIDRGVSVNVLNFGKLDSTPIGRLTVTCLAGFAEFERNMIVERTSAGKAYKRATDPNYHEGRMPLQYDKTVFETLYAQVQSGVITAKEASERLGVGRTSWYKIVKERAAC